MSTTFNTAVPFRHDLDSLSDPSQESLTSEISEDDLKQDRQPSEAPEPVKEKDKQLTKTPKDISEDNLKQDRQPSKAPEPVKEKDKQLTKTPKDIDAPSSLSLLSSSCDEIRQNTLQMGEEPLFEKIYSGQIKDSLSLSLLSNKQLMKLQLSRLTIDQMKMLFPMPSNDYPYAYHAARFALINPNEVKRAIEIDEFRGAPYLFDYMSPDQVGCLDFRLVRTTVPAVAIFSTYKLPYVIDPMFVNQLLLNRMRVVSVEQVNYLFQKNWLNCKKALKLLSEQHLRGLELSKMTSEQVEMLFPQSSPKEFPFFAERFSLIPPEEVQKALEAKILYLHYMCDYFSLDQVSCLDFRKISVWMMGRVLFPRDQQNVSEEVSLAKINTVPKEVLREALTNGLELNYLRYKVQL